MSKGPVARSFRNRRLDVDGASFAFGVSGPGICAPCLYALGWLQYADHVVGIAASALAQNTGAAAITLFANHGAPPEPGRHIALTLGDIPRRSAIGPSIGSSTGTRVAWTSRSTLPS
jgi:hypothetical protein